MKPNLLAAAVLFTLACAAGGLVQAQTPGANLLRVQQVQIVDRQGFEKPMVAATMFVPAGWRVESGVRWNIQAPCVRPYQQMLRASAADGVGALELLPGEGWGRSSMSGPLSPGCPMVMLTSAGQYLQSWVQRNRSGARIVENKPRPDKGLQMPPMQMQGYEGRQWVEAAEALIQWSEQGRTLHERVAVVVLFGHHRMANPMGGPPMETFSGESAGVLTWRGAEAPSARHFDTLWAALRTDPTWKGRIDHTNQQMAQDNANTQMKISQMRHQSNMEALREQAKRGQIAHETRQEIAGMQMEGWRAGQASQDRNHKANVQSLREVQSFRDPDGKEVELPNHYRHAWKLNDGSFVLTDDVNFDPQRDLRMRGQQMKPMPR